MFAKCQHKILTETENLIIMSNIDKNIIFFDIDGTLVNFSCEMPESTREALQKLHKNGHYLVVSTGRSKSEVYPWLLDMHWDGLICGAGAYIEWNREIIYSKYMSDLMVKIITEYLETNNGTYILEGSSAIWEKRSLKEINRAHIEKWIKSSHGNGSNAPIPTARLFDDISEVSLIHKLNFHGMTASAQTIENELNEIFSQNNLPAIHAIKFNTGNHFHSSGEITLSGIHKSYGIDLLLNTAHIAPSSSIAFGDSLNDYEMIKNAGIGIAMGNACDELKEIATYTTSHIDDNGIYNACHKLKLI